LKKLLIRTLSGLVYVVLTVGSILISKYTFFAFFTLVLAYTLYEFYRLSKNDGVKPQFILGILTAIYLFVSFFLYDMKLVTADIFLGMIPLLMLVPIVELIKGGERTVQNIAYTILGIVYIAFPFSMLNFIVTPIQLQPEKYMPEVLLCLFILLWANDSGAYLFGSWLGKHKMIERISPKKTWEGAVGGALLTMVVSVVMFRILNVLGFVDAIVLSLITVVAGTLGDLIESMIKRHFHVKDSGAIMPGHGGLLDRFDSMLLAAPVYYIYITLILN